MGALDRISVAAIGNSVAELEAETLRAEVRTRRVEKPDSYGVLSPFRAL